MKSPTGRLLAEARQCPSPNHDERPAGDEYQYDACSGGWMDLPDPGIPSRHLAREEVCELLESGVRIGAQRYQSKLRSDVQVCKSRVLCHAFFGSSPSVNV